MNENKSLKIKKNRRKTKKIAMLFTLTGITAIVLIVETYAWFIGTGSVYANDFEIGVSAGENLLLSLDGETWDSDIDISEATIAQKPENPTGEGPHGLAYANNTNHWAGANGLVPISTDGASDPEAAGRLKLYGKSSLTATQGGFRLISTRIKNYTDEEGALTTEKDGYVVFDMFVKNGSGVDYIEEYKDADDEAIYLTKDSFVKAIPEGEKDYGLANSVRVAFVQIGRVAATTNTVGDITSITCGEDATANTSLCDKVATTIWEPNDTSHDSNLISYFETVCKQKTVVEAEEPDGVPTITYGEACTPLVEGTAVSTYVVNQNITSDHNVDVYDGINGAPKPEQLTQSLTFTDTMKIKNESERPTFFKLAANSITKIRVYIYLEGQDVDNYDLVTLGKTVRIKFGFTKDQMDLATTTTSAAAT